MFNRSSRPEHGPHTADAIPTEDVGLGTQTQKAAAPAIWPPSVQISEFDSGGLIEPAAGQWMMSLIRQLIAEGKGLAEVERCIRSQGEPLSKDEVRALGARANTKLGHEFVAALTPSGRKDVINTAHQLMYLNYSLPETKRQTAEILRSDLCEYVELLCDNSSFTCRMAKRLAKTPIPRHGAPMLPLDGCNKECQCSYVAHFDLRDIDH